MLYVPETAVRAWLPPRQNPSSKHPRFVGGRRDAMGRRVLVLDLETTTGIAQSLLFGFFQVRADDQLEHEALVTADELEPRDSQTIKVFAEARGLSIYSRSEFIGTVFYPEIFELGTLCVGFNLPFDITRLPVHVGLGRGRYRRAFNVQLSKNIYRPRIRVESISARAAFIGFARSKRRTPRHFQGRFLDCKTLVSAFTGESHTLRSAGELFQTEVRKSELAEYGSISAESLAYARNDVSATWSLYTKLRQEYACYGFATFENEFNW